MENQTTKIFSEKLSETTEHRTQKDERREKEETETNNTIELLRPEAGVIAH